MKHRYLALALSIGTALMSGSMAMAGKADDTLRVVWGVSVPNLDPYFNNLREGIIFADHVFDTLLWRNPETGEYLPHLATGWEWIDDKTLDVTLREGVTFHNGETFDADDVVYTLNFIANPDNTISTPRYGAWIDNAEKKGDYSVRINMKEPFPVALEYLSSAVPIYPSEYHQEVGVEGMGQAPVGTGPYRAVSIEGDKRFVLERNDSYFGTETKGSPMIANLEIRTINDSSAQVLELLSGQSDWIWKYNTDQLERLNSMPNVEAVQGESMRIGFIVLNAKGEGDNPMADVRVRQAVNHAINRQNLVEFLVQGDSRVIDTPCYPGQFGCDGGSAISYEYDPEKAKALLVEAGYADGLETGLTGFRNAQWTAAIQNDLAKVGIDAAVSMVGGSVLVEQTQKGELPLAHWDWGSYSINDVSAVLPNFFADGGYDRAGDAEVKALVEQAGSSTEAEERKRLYADAIRLITERAYWVPLHTFVINYAYSSELNFPTHSDEKPRYYMSSWR